MLVCHQEMEAYDFNITVSPTGQVLFASRLNNEIKYSALPTSPLALQILNANLVNVAIRGLEGIAEMPYELTLHDDSKPNDWYSYLMAGMMNNTFFLDPKAPPPPALSMIEPVSKTWSLLTVLLLSNIYTTNSILIPISTEEGPRVFRGKINYTETRVQMSKPMFILAASILSLNLLTFIVFSVYVRRNRLPWVPKSIVATLAYLAWG